MFNAQQARDWQNESYSLFKIIEKAAKAGSSSVTVPQLVLRNIYELQELGFTVGKRKNFGSRSADAMYESVISW